MSTLWLKSIYTKQSEMIYRLGSGVLKNKIGEKYLKWPNLISFRIWVVEHYYSAHGAFVVSPSHTGESLLARDIPKLQTDFKIVVIVD